MDDGKKEKMLEKLEKGKNPYECADIYEQITQLLAEVKTGINNAYHNMTGENELDYSRFNK